MPYAARVFRILIASPSDVSQERDIISRIIQEWNDLYSFEKKIVLLPLRWETHSAPELGSRPQDIINKEVVDYCDMAIGVFWTRIGSPTGKADSGTLEEIERVGKSEKIVMLYFSQAKVDPENIDLEQLKKLREFKVKNYPNGLIEQYKDPVEFRDKLTKQLEIKLRSLINKDIQENSELPGVSTNPNLELGFYDGYADSYLGKVISVSSKILTINGADKIPDYKKEKGDKATLSSGGTISLVTTSQTNKDYYRKYIEYLKLESFFHPIQFYLNNISQIGIRDIFIEIKMPKVKSVVLRNKKISKPKKVYDYFMSSVDDDGYDEIELSENELFYTLRMSYDALQPQRKIIMDDMIYFGSSESCDVECKALIYADCFPKPLEETLTIKFEVENVTIDPMQTLKDLDVL